VGRLEQAIARIDAVHAEDPNRTETGGGPVAAELAYAQRMSRWLSELEPDASEALQLAVRAQHLRRWSVPRDQYPDGRSGYKRWRSDLARMHADTAGELLREVGYEEETVGRVQDLILKKRLKTDPEVQTLEDVACLVFLEYYFSDFRLKHEEDKLIRILQKTWGKMSESARQRALQLALPAPERELLERALG
jgi:hypothetical protein